MMEHSIKARVIALAQSDPYLTVKDLAHAAGTTTPYVRTILSEAELSLHEMRRLYARRLERHQGKERPGEIHAVQAELTITKGSGSELCPSVTRWANLELFLASTLHKRESLLCYEQLITQKELRVGTGLSHSLRELLPADCQEQLEVAEQKAEILLPAGELGNALGLEIGDHALRLTTFLTVQEELVALEIRWLGLDGLVLQWSRLRPELEIGLGS